MFKYILGVAFLQLTQTDYCEQAIFYSKQNEIFLREAEKKPSFLIALCRCTSIKAAKLMRQFWRKSYPFSPNVFSCLVQLHISRLHRKFIKPILYTNTADVDKSKVQSFLYKLKCKEDIYYLWLKCYIVNAMLNAYYAFLVLFLNFLRIWIDSLSQLVFKTISNKIDLALKTTILISYLWVLFFFPR